MKTHRMGLAAVVLFAASMMPWLRRGALCDSGERRSERSRRPRSSAPKSSPLQYYYASEHLTKAMSEAAEGDYSDANEFAGIAEEYADKAIKLSKEAHRGAGR